MIATVPPTTIQICPDDSPDTATGSTVPAGCCRPGSSVTTTAMAGSGEALADAEVGLELGEVGDGGLGAMLAGALALRDGAWAATATAGIGWIETYRPSQTIFMGAYFHGVKKRLSWAVVSFVFGAMS